MRIPDMTRHQDSEPETMGGSTINVRQGTGALTGNTAIGLDFEDGGWRLS
jgi:hypothetical protein